MVARAPHLFPKAKIQLAPVVFYIIYILYIHAGELSHRFSTGFEDFSTGSEDFSTTFPQRGYTYYANDYFRRTL